MLVNISFDDEDVAYVLLDNVVAVHLKNTLLNLDRNMEDGVELVAALKTVLAYFSV
jgi:hypothetical protein